VVFEGEWECAYCGLIWDYDETDERPEKLTGDTETNVYTLPCPTCKSPVSRPVPKLTDAPV
jgi:rubredoxin